MRIRKLFIVFLIITGLFLVFYPIRIFGEIVPDIGIATSTGEFTTATEEFFIEEELFFKEESLGGELLLLGNGCGTIFCDDFNSYNDGDLNGQGSWVKTSGATTNVQGTTVKEGAKAVSQAGSSVYKKTGDLLNAGKITVYIRTTNNGAAASYRNFVLYEGTTQRIVVGNPWNSNDFGYVNSAPAWVVITTYPANTYFPVEIEWRSTPSKQVRYRVNEGTWTDWVAPYTSWTSGLQTVQIGGDGTDTGYFDYIAENPYEEPPVGLNYIKISGLIALSIFIIVLFNFLKQHSAKI